MVVAHQILVEPVEHALAPLAPQREIMREADTLDCDIGASLLEPERETGEFVSEHRAWAASSGAMARSSRVRSTRNATAAFFVEHAEFELRIDAGKFAARPVTITCPPLSRAIKLTTAATASSSSTLSRIISQVGWASSHLNAASFFTTSSRASFSGRSRTSAAGERREARVQCRWIGGAHEEQRRIVCLLAKRIFDREPRLADTAKPVQCPAGDRDALVGDKRRTQIVDLPFAAHE